MESLAAALEAIAAWHWFVLGLALLIAELVSGSTYLLWPAAAAWLVGLVMLFLPIGWPAQLALFGLGTLVPALTAGRYVRGRWLARAGQTSLNENSARLIGVHAQALGDFVHGRGRLRLGDTVWQGQSGEAVADGDRVEVMSVEGSTLNVRPVPKAS